MVHYKGWLNTPRKRKPRLALQASRNQNNQRYNRYATTTANTGRKMR